MGYLNLVKYPFVARPSDLGLPDEAGFSIVIDSLSDRLREVFPIVFRSIVHAEMRIDPRVFTDDAESVACYRLLLAVAKAIGDRRLVNRVALAYAKTAGKSLMEEEDSVLISLSSRIGLHLEYLENPPTLPVFGESTGRKRVKGFFTPLNYSLPWAEYAGIVSGRLSQDPSYSLENNVVEGGKVYMDKRTVVRVLEEAITGYIVSDASVGIGTLGIDLGFFLEEARKILSEAGWFKTLRVEQGYGKAGEVAPEKFPPCILRIIGIIESGGNPSHEERFNLAAFLANIGLDVDSILEYFRKTPDFNEKIARYQIEHISGVRGSGKKYMPYSCEKMKSMGICPVEGKCKGGRNPLAVYRYNLRSARPGSIHGTSQQAS